MMLVFSLGELTSITAFAGGAYGYSRCSIGPFYGYMFGMFEMLQNNFFTIVSIDACVTSSVIALNLNPQQFEPVFFVLYYLVLFLILYRGGSLFWYLMCGFAVVAFLIILAFSVATMSDTSSTSVYAHHLLTSFDGGLHEFFKDLLFPCMIFIGAETATVAGAKIANVSSFYLSFSYLCSD